MNICIEFGEFGNLYADFDSEFSKVDGVWLTHNDLPDLDITAYLSPAEIEAAQQQCISEREKDAEYAQAAIDDRGDWLYEQRKDLAMEMQSEALSQGENQRGVK